MTTEHQPPMMPGEPPREPEKYIYFMGIESEPFLPRQPKDECFIDGQWLRTASENFLLSSRLYRRRKPTASVEASVEGPENPPEAFFISLRDYFAGQALIGIISKTDVKPPISLEEKMKKCRDIADGAFLYADAMLRARTKGPQ
jgi:hypothetical protein